MSAYRADPRFAGFDGSGTTVAVIDTGIDVNSSFFGPDRNGDGVSDRIVYQYDFADHDGDASDRSGHGSNVSSIIAGSDATYGGVAPGADIVALKVFSDNGAGYFAYVEQALQWVVANAAAYHISVVNLSLGDGADWTTASSRYGLGDEFAALASEGVIVVAAAGNGFYSFGSQPGVSYPASDPNVLAVGAVWSGDYGGPWRFANGATDATTGADRIASFSQRGDQVDVFAPGARLTGANATGGLSTMQGTSQASAYFAGVAALAQELAESHLGRLLTPQEFVGLVKTTSDRIVDGDDENDNVANSGASYGRVNVERLATAIMALTPAAGGGSGSGTNPGAGTPSTPTRSLSGHALTIGTGDHVTGIDFGAFRLGTIAGSTISDADKDGVRDAGEMGVSGRTVFLDADGDNVFDAGERSTITAADGSFSFADIGPGLIMSGRCCRQALSRPDAPAPTSR
ncbi:S8 family peptidase [Terrarubrum flagellatum]|uniref:S8 family peptidase n=1 Tax=Terrirubrum flagellatum TaxID=2895980 RepID=UPI003145523A